MTQAFAFSRLKKQTSKLPSWLPCNLDTDYRRNTKWGPDLIFQALPCTATLLSNLVKITDKIKKFIYMTLSWLPGDLCIILRTDIKWEALL